MLVLRQVNKCPVVLSSIFSKDLKRGWKSMFAYIVINWERLVGNAKQSGECKRLQLDLKTEGKYLNANWNVPIEKDLPESLS